MKKQNKKQEILARKESKQQSQPQNNKINQLEYTVKQDSALPPPKNVNIKHEKVNNRLKLKTRPNTKTLDYQYRDGSTSTDPNPQN